MIGGDPNREYEKLKAASAAARLPFERDAWLNTAFYLGEQYTQWTQPDKAAGYIQRIPRNNKTPNTPRPVVNKIMHYVQQEHSMVLQDHPTPDVLPSTDDIQDQMDAGIGRAYCDHVADASEANYDAALSRAALGCVINGTGYLKWCWNAQEKKHEILPCSFFEIYPDPYATEFKKNRYIIHAKFMDVEQVFETWGVEIAASKVEKADAMRTELLRGMGSAPVLAGVTVNELWMKPCRKHPEGLYVVWSGRETLVPAQALPYNHKHLPFTQIGCIERPDSQFFMSPVTYLRPAQMELNKYHAQRIMIREKTASPKWWIDSELELEEDPNDHPFQILRGTGGISNKEPKLIDPPSMADNGDGAMIEEQMMHIVGLHEVSQAQVPGRVEAAKAIEMLKDSDDSRQESMRKTINASTAEGFYQVLENARQYEDEEKMILTYSQDGIAEVKRFRKGALKPGYRVRVTQTSGLARSRAARWDQLQRMWDSKIITDPEVMAGLMDVPIPTFINHKAVDIKLARNENLDLARGIAIVPSSWDDHSIHIREHNTWRKTHEFQVLSDDTKTKFEHHCQTHDNLYDAELVKLAKRAQIAAMAQGAPTGPPGGPAAPPGDTATPEQ